MPVRIRRDLLALVLALGTGGVAITGGAAGAATGSGVVDAAARPVISRIGPASGSTVGGGRVTVLGSGFAHVNSVHFGSARGGSVRVLSSTRLTVTTPAHRAGAVNILVTTSTGNSGYHPADHFTYRSPLVVLDPGHNGGNAAHTSTINRPVNAGYGRRKACNTTGTQTDSGYPEHAFTWDVALRARAILLRHSVRILLTRPNDTGVGPCVDRRARIQSTRGVSAAVAIHADGAPASGHGFHVNEDSRRPVHASRASVVRSTALGIALHRALLHGSGLVASTYIGRNGYVRRDDLAGLNLSTSPTSFLELGNMRNAGDARRQRSAVGRERIAAAIAAGVLAYLRG